jgi:hypothetical protein
LRPGARAGKVAQAAWAIIAKNTFAEAKFTAGILLDAADTDALAEGPNIPADLALAITRVQPEDFDAGVTLEEFLASLELPEDEDER